MHLYESSHPDLHPIYAERNFGYTANRLQVYWLLRPSSTEKKDPAEESWLYYSAFSIACMSGHSYSTYIFGGLSWVVWKSVWKLRRMDQILCECVVNNTCWKLYGDLGWFSRVIIARSSAVLQARLMAMDVPGHYGITLRGRNKGRFRCRDWVVLTSRGSYARSCRTRRFSGQVVSVSQFLVTLWVESPTECFLAY